MALPVCEIWCKVNVGVDQGWTRSKWQTLEIYLVRKWFEEFSTAKPTRASHRLFHARNQPSVSLIEAPRSTTTSAADHRNFPQSRNPTPEDSYLQDGDLWLMLPWYIIVHIALSEGFMYLRDTQYMRHTSIFIYNMYMYYNYITHIYIYMICIINILPIYIWYVL